MSGRTTSATASAISTSVFQPRLEGLEGRLLLSGAASLEAGSLAAQAAAVIAASVSDITVNEDAAPTTLNLVALADPVYEFRGALGNFDVHLFQDLTPITVANFKAYADAKDYAFTFIHRSMPGFVIQGGGFLLGASGIEEVPSRGAILNEPGISNTRGTIAMAKLGEDPNSADSQWFFNLGDNSANLDNQNGGFTVFGEVLGSGMSVVDDIAALPVVNAGGVFSDLPVRGYTGGDIQLENLIAFQGMFPVKPVGYQVVGNTNPGLVTAIANRSGKLTVQYVPDKSGQAQVTVRTAYADGATVDEILNVTVNAVNDAPVVPAQMFQTPVGAAKTIAVGAADAETAYANLTFAVVALPQHGTLTETGHGQYLYQPQAGYLGPDSFQVTVTDDGDPAGSHISPAETTGTVALAVGEVKTFRAKAPAVFTDANNNVVTVKLSGPGSGSLYFAAGTAPNMNANATRLILEGTTDKSSLTISLKAPRGVKGATTTVGSIEAAGSVKKISAKTTNVSDLLEVTGTLPSLTLNNVSGLLTALTVGKAASLKFNVVTDAKISWAGPISSLSANEWWDTDGTADVIEAGTFGRSQGVKKVKIKGHNDAPIPTLLV